MDGVAQQGAAGLDPRGWADPGDAVDHGDLPPVAAPLGGFDGELDVVPSAEQGEIVEVGVSAIHPGNDVVGLTGVGGDSAAGDDAAAVPRDQGALLGRGDEAPGAAEVQDGTLGRQQGDPDL